jgi:NADH-quinone oxidoreductase subunit L
MVTAGVFMVARMSPLFEYSDTALTVVAVVGAATALFAATVGCVQNDIKRVIAYSTCSQLGYMFFALGVSAYPAAMFHLFTHAFFKALLFLGAGSVIHAMSDEQDIRRMGGIWRHVPLTYALMVVGSLALAGIPPFAGYWSKDFILEAAWAADTPVGKAAYAVGGLVALLTAFYSWRLLILVFHGKPRADEHVMAHVHESPLVMTVPLVALSLGAMFAGVLGATGFVGEDSVRFWGKAILLLPSHEAMPGAHHVPTLISLLPTALALAGIGLAYLMYMVAPSLPGLLADTVPGLYRFVLKKWYFDELYDLLFVRPAFRLGRALWQGGDGALIDGVGPDGVAAATRFIARRVGLLQSGYLYHYAFAMLIGVAVCVTWYVVRLG